MPDKKLPLDECEVSWLISFANELARLGPAAQASLEALQNDDWEAEGLDYSVVESIRVSLGPFHTEIKGVAERWLAADFCGQHDHQDRNQPPEAANVDG